MLRSLTSTWDSALRAARLAGLPFGAGLTAAEHVSLWHDRQEWPERPLRIGLISPGSWAVQLAEAEGVGPVEWFSVPSDRPFAPQSYLLDACIRALPDEGFEITTLERAGKDAAWFDWGGQRPMSYPGVFPARIDCSRISLASADANEVDLVRLLVEAAAILSRHPARLDLSDRLGGRRPLLGVPEPVRRVSRYTPARDTVSELAMRLVAELSRFRAGAVATPAERAASRFVSAWACMWPGDHDEETRRLAGETAARVTCDEPETVLRLASLRFAAMDDAAGLEALGRAERLLRGRDLIGADQTVFLSGELDAGQPGARTTGRIAVGVCLVAATMPMEELAFFAEDLGDDLRHAAALVGRDQDHRLILEIIRMVERHRRDDASEVASAHAA